jgi:hypothetical protein
MVVYKMILIYIVFVKFTTQKTQIIHVPEFPFPKDYSC